MNIRQLDMVLEYLDEGTKIDMKKFINESRGEVFVEDFTILIDNKKYKIHNSVFSVDYKFKAEIIKEATKLLKNEREIIDQVYKKSCEKDYKRYYGENYRDYYEEDRKNDYIDSFKLTYPDFYPGKFNLGIYLSNINQLHTMFNNGKIIEKETYAY